VVSTFIDTIEWISLPLAQGGDYSGLIARCRFRQAEYDDALFASSGVLFPANFGRAVVKRKAEYLAGRVLAQQVLAQLGHPGFSLISGVDRAPQWPVAIAGALSHNSDTVLCAAHQISPSLQGVGIDVESFIAADKAETLWTRIISPQEYNQLHQQAHPFSQLLTLAFSAKESLFKTLYPLVGHYFDFLDAQLTELNLQQQRFQLTLLKDLSPRYRSGQQFNGYFKLSAENVTTFLTCD